MLLSAASSALLLDENGLYVREKLILTIEVIYKNKEHVIQHPYVTLHFEKIA